jgi:hypothetical protein
MKQPLIYGPKPWIWVLIKPNQCAAMVLTRPASGLRQSDFIRQFGRMLKFPVAPEINLFGPSRASWTLSVRFEADQADQND